MPSFFNQKYPSARLQILQNADEHNHYHLPNVQDRVAESKATDSSRQILEEQDPDLRTWIGPSACLITRRNDNLPGLLRVDVPDAFVGSQSETIQQLSCQSGTLSSSCGCMIPNFSKPRLNPGSRARVLEPRLKQLFCPEFRFQPEYETQV